MTTHEAAANAASAATYVGAAISAGAATPHYVFGMTLDQWSILGIMFGMLMALAGWLTNVYFKRQHFKLTREALRALPSTALKVSDDD